MRGWADACAEMGVDLRPHFKAHKCTELARLQVEAGAVGLTVATVAEAMALIEVGLDDVLIANQVVQPSQIEWCALASLRARIAVLVDEEENLRAIALAAERVGEWSTCWWR